VPVVGVVQVETRVESAWLPFPRLKPQHEATAFSIVDTCAPTRWCNARIELAPKPFKPFL